MAGYDLGLLGEASRRMALNGVIFDEEVADIWGLTAQLRAAFALEMEAALTF